MNKVFLFFGLAVMPVLSGCIGVSMHSMHPSRIVVKQQLSNVPAANLPLKIIYDYDSYGLFYFFNTPPGTTAVTDNNGVAIVDLADFRYRILLEIDGRITSFSKQQIIEGGTISFPPYDLVLSPKVSP